MNKFIYVIIVFVFTGFFKEIKSQISAIEINSSILVNDKSEGDYSILIYIDGTLKDSIYSKKSKGIIVSLEKNKLYSLVFKKSNFKNKLVLVNTNIPAGLRELNEEPFVLQIEMNSTLNDKSELEDYPIAILSLSKKEKSLVASESYHKFTH